MIFNVRVESKMCIFLFSQVLEMLLLGSPKSGYHWGSSRTTNFIRNCVSAAELFLGSFRVLQLDWSGQYDEKTRYMMVSLGESACTSVNVTGRIGICVVLFSN